MSEPMDRTEGPVTGSRFARAHHILLYFIGGALAVWLLTGFYQVQTGQVAVVERLGVYSSPIDGRTENGLHYHLPWPIERVNLISVQQQYTMSVNAFNTSPAEYANFKISLMRSGNADPQLLDALFDPYVVTGDRSVAHVDITVQFTVDDPLAWLQSVSHEYSQAYDPKASGDMRNQMFQQIAQRAIVAQMGHVPLNTVLQEGRETLRDGIRKTMQEAMDHPNPGQAMAGDPHGGLGVRVQSVTIASVGVPARVTPAYENLVNQLQFRQANINNAQAARQATIIRAQGEMSTLISEAEVYRQNTVQAAKGEASRFGEVLKQYEQAPEMTRVNMAVDAARTVYGSATRIILARPGQPVNLFVDPPQYNAAQPQPGQ